jgi:rRNA processing protein Gar1
VIENLKKLGTIINIRKDILIARSIKPPKIGEEVFDYRGTPIGHVTSIFGPVKSPYFRVRLKNNVKPKGYVFGGEYNGRGKEKGKKGVD